MQLFYKNRTNVKCVQIKSHYNAIIFSGVIPEYLGQCNFLYAILFDGRKINLDEYIGTVYVMWSVKICKKR